MGRPRLTPKERALDLINRQKAEIERLRESAKTLSDALADIEAVHGRWVKSTEREYDYVCSVCGGVCL